MINKDRLKPGDILFYKVTTKSMLISKIVALGQKLCGSSFWDHSYSHVSIVGEDCSFIYEARIPKSRKTALSIEFINKLNKHYDMEAYRLKDVTPEQLQQIFTWCASHMDQKYDFGLFFFGLIDGSNKEICSSFIVKALENAKLAFATNIKKFTSPDKLYEILRPHMRKVRR